MENLDEDLQNEKETLDGLSEVEIFFVLQHYFNLRLVKSEESEKMKFAYNYINKTLLPKYKVTDAGETISPKFNRWLKFWKNWQGSLSIGQIQDIINNMELLRSYDQYLPKIRWNQLRPKST